MAGHAPPYQINHSTLGTHGTLHNPSNHRTGCVKGRDTQRSDLGCPLRQLALALILTDAKEPGKEAIAMGLAPEQLADLSYELEQRYPKDEQDFEPFGDEDIQWGWAE